MNNREFGSTPTDALLKIAGIDYAQFQEDWRVLLSFLPSVVRDHAQNRFSSQEQMLATVVSNLFNNTELARLAAQVGYDFNQRPQASRAEHIIRLVAYTKSSGRIDSLATLITSQRFSTGLPRLENAEAADTRTPIEKEVTELLGSSFNQSELEDLCFKLGIGYDNLWDPAGKKVALVNHCKRLGALPQLKTMILTLRPHLSPNFQAGGSMSNPGYTTPQQGNYTYPDQGRPATYYNTPPQAPTTATPPYQQPSAPTTGERYIHNQRELSQKLSTLYTSKLDRTLLAAYFDVDLTDLSDQSMFGLAQHAGRDPQRLRQVLQLLDRGEKVFTNLTYKGPVLPAVDKLSNVLEIARDLSRKFDQTAELAAVCQQFGVDHEILGGSTVEDNLFRLVHYLNRRHKLAGLIQLVYKIK